MYDDVINFDDCKCDTTDWRGDIFKNVKFDRFVPYESRKLCLCKTYIVDSLTPFPILRISDRHGDQYIFHWVAPVADTVVSNADGKRMIRYDFVSFKSTNEVLKHIEYLESIVPKIGITFDCADDLGLIDFCERYNLKTDGQWRDKKDVMVDVLDALYWIGPFREMNIRLKEVDDSRKVEVCEYSWKEYSTIEPIDISPMDAKYVLKKILMYDTVFPILLCQEEGFESDTKYLILAPVIEGNMPTIRYDFCDIPFPDLIDVLWGYMTKPFYTPCDNVIKTMLQRANVVTYSEDQINQLMKHLDKYSKQRRHGWYY